jgi:hypothetical protein
MRTGCIHSSASLLIEANSAAQAPRLVNWPGIGSEVGARARLPIRSVLLVNPERRRFVRRLIRTWRFAAVEFVSMTRYSIERLPIIPFWQRPGRLNFLANFDRMKAA